MDALTKRSKAAETAFLTSYKRLIDLPDPIPILEQAVVMQGKLEKAQVGLAYKTCTMVYVCGDLVPSWHHSTVIAVLLYCTECYVVCI